MLYFAQRLYSVKSMICVTPVGISQYREMVGVSPAASFKILNRKGRMNLSKMESIMNKVGECTSFTLTEVTEQRRFDPA